MRLGVLDIGSYSAQLQVVEVYSGAPPLPTHAIKVPVRLHETIDEDGSLNPDGVGRIIRAIRDTLSQARSLRVERLYVFTTAVVRDATNRETVLDTVARETGIRPEYLSGEDEGRLTYLAVHRWYGWSSGRQLVIDIGGGSMEIMLGRDVQPDLAVSLPLGARRLTREFLNDLPTKRQVRALRDHVRDSLREVADRLRWEGPSSRAVVTSKTCKQLARLCGAPAQSGGPFARRVLVTEDIAGWIPMLRRMPAAQRAELRGISRDRAGQILGGAVIAHTTLTELGVERADLCPWALREGIMLRHLEAHTNDPATLPLAPVDTPLA